MKFDAKSFVNETVLRIKEVIGKEKAIVACSGGVDSTTCAVLTHKAIGENLICIFLDTNFMRLNEPERVVETLRKPPMNLHVKKIDVRERFMKSLEGIEDAEEKRKAFRETFYTVLSEIAEKEGCKFLIQGTIAPDVIETSNRIKTQHNVLSQIGIDPVEKYGFQVIEPIVTLYKPQVREVARYLGIPPEISERQPFCGPGLSVRCVGLIKPEKLQELKKATAIVEEVLAKEGAHQYFAAILDSATETDPVALKIQNVASSFLKLAEQVKVSILKNKATGIKEGRRLYGKIALIDARSKEGEVYKPPIEVLIKLQEKLSRENPDFSRFLYNLTEKPREEPYIIAIRAIKTEDFMTANVASISWEVLEEAESLIMKQCKRISCVSYDITPKPPATIEFE